MGTDLLGKTLGEYRLDEIVGSGGLATVYKAYQSDLERWVAVKVLHYKERRALLRFQREAQAIARLRHRNIVIVYDYGEQDLWPYIVMEYVEGGTLNDYLSGEPLDWIKVVDLAIAIAEALAYAHGQGVIHRDVKPSNILMPQDDWPLLADFGLVKLSDVEQTLTGKGMSVGTPAYTAPEQGRGATVDHRSDMYSLGVVLFEMITGRLPFDYQNPNRILLAHMSDPVPSPRDINPDCPAGLEQIILTAMQKAPDKRYENMRKMTKTLTDVLEFSGEASAIRASRLAQSAETLVKDPSKGVSPSDRPAEQSITQPKDQFPISSAARGARIFLPDQKVTIAVPNKDSNIIGRTHRRIVADIDLGAYGAAEAGVSRRHAHLVRRSTEWLIEDLGSLNGTYVNDVRVEPGNSVSLRDGDLIRCSHMSFIFLTPSDA
jgi:serine/threonine protein kinase